MDQPSKPKFYFVLGGPGAGKGTQCAKLVQNMGFVHLSAGDLLRQERSSHSEVGDLIKKCMKEGKIVPSYITTNLLAKAIEKNGFDKKYLIDGFPRNEENLQSWFDNVSDKTDFQKLLYFDCNEKCLKQRILLRGETSQRIDDNIDSFMKRYKQYVEETQPIVDHFRKQSKVITINGNDSVDNVYKLIIAQLEQ